MADPYVGEIKMFGGNFAPVGWALCDGSALSIAQYPILYSLIGTTYGGDGQTNFNLPNLKGRAPIHRGQGAGLSNHSIGQSGGTETVTLTASQLPVHTHTALCNTSPGTTTNPAGNYWAASSDLRPYSTQAPNASMLAVVGGGQSHDNMPPFLVINFIIALDGIYPSP
jgi:microcystin-dependent protein